MYCAECLLVSRLGELANFFLILGGRTRKRHSFETIKMASEKMYPPLDQQQQQQPAPEGGYLPPPSYDQGENEAGPH